MLICTECGKDNQLGRVFCASCGAKLDLSGMTSDAIIETQSSGGVVKRHWAKVVVLVVLLIVAIMGLALWPNTAVLGAKGTRNDGRRANTGIRALSKVRRGQKLARKFREKEINGYLSEIKASRWKIRTSVELHSGYVKVRIVKPLFSKGLNLKGKVFNPKVSYDFACLAISGKLVVKKATMGHLPLGPLGFVAASAGAAIVADKDLAALQASLTDIKITEEGAELFAKK